MIKILIVDDDRMKLGWIERCIREIVVGRSDVSVVAELCSSVYYAVKAIEREKPDVLCFDFCYPEDDLKRTGADLAVWVDRRCKEKIAMACISSMDLAELQGKFAGLDLDLHVTCINSSESDPSGTIREFVLANIAA